ncbi:MAG: 2,3-bisphosphoglycerate-independent phosphoglycerate mutase [Phycisphaerales bacterium]|nr:2,3-bisphosphoglycerate-independent phosphoglycerate mutase [Phycisphaerales bacterium]
MPAPSSNTPLVLIIRDGWGENPNPEHDRFNAIKLARTPVADMLDAEWPRTLIHTSGEDVGLPEGTMGNSEVGHQNIGAGRIVDQESVAITKACRAGLEGNAAIAGAVQNAKRRGGKVHLLGIASDAGVHGLLTHLYAIVRACKRFDMPRVAVHLFTDGRDTGPYTGKGYIEQIERELAAIGIGRIATLCGRYYAMDRDFRWERVGMAFDALTGRGSTPAPNFPTAAAAIQEYYDHPTGDSQQGDEFVTARAVGEPAPIRDGDSVIFYNYRGDRPREISAAFVFPDEQWSRVKPSPDSGRNGFDRGRKLDIDYVIMTEYWESLLPYVKVAFPKPPKMVNIAGEYMSKIGVRQFRCAETEKYPHVTFFFNDYRDEPFPGERRENPQSPKVATYDLKPEMAAEEVCRAVLGRFAAPDCEEFIVVNFANGDMVGHTGKLEAAIKACETVDNCVGRIIKAATARGGSLIITADHGNAEQMWDPVTNAPHTAHTTYDVPLYVVGSGVMGRGLRQEPRGRLADILPTALEMMGLPKPAEMTGRSLLV